MGAETHAHHDLHVALERVPNSIVPPLDLAW